MLKKMQHDQGSHETHNTLQPKLLFSHWTSRISYVVYCKP